MGNVGGENEALSMIGHHSNLSASTSLNVVDVLSPSSIEARSNGAVRISSTTEESRRSKHRFGGQQRVSEGRTSSTLSLLKSEPQMIRKYVANRWRIFADYTTLHGVKEIYKAPLRKLKILWLIILTLCAAIMLFQIYKLTVHFLTEPVTTTVTVKNDFYQLPLFLLVAHTHELFSADGQHKSRSRLKVDELDTETLAYAHSLVDKKVFLPPGFDFTSGKRKFDKYLVEHQGVSWHDVLEPYLHDLSTWIGGDNRLNVWRRSMWHIATYHLLEPLDKRSTPLELTHDFIVEVQLQWNAANSPPMTDEAPVSLILTSYGLLTEAIRLEAGHIYKIRFEMTSHRSVNLRRKACRTGATQYLMYDQQKCNETCLAKAEMEHAPRTCYEHKLYEWGFYDMYNRMRPCSYGYFNGSGGPFGVETSDSLNGGQGVSFGGTGSNAKVHQAYKKCFDEQCLPACEQLSVRFSTTTREFGNDLRNRSLLFVTWPAPNAVQVYDEALQYTWDGFVGQLGGLIGLWMGASMMSAFEAFYLCCCCCYDVVSEDEYEDEERTYGMRKRQKRKGGDDESISMVNRRPHPQPPPEVESIYCEQNEVHNGLYNLHDLGRNEIWLPRTVYD